MKFLVCLGDGPFDFGWWYSCFSWKPRPCWKAVPTSVAFRERLELQKPEGCLFLFVLGWVSGEEVTVNFG